MSDDTMGDDWEAVTAEQVKQAQEGDLIPTGTYEGQVQGHTTRTVDKEESPLYGRKLARLTTDLFNVDGKTRKHFFDVAPGLVKDDGALRSESKLAAQLAQHTDTVGQPFSETLSAATNTRLRFRVRLAPAKGAYEARNWTDAITAL